MHSKTIKIPLKAKKKEEKLKSRGFWYFHNYFCIIIKLAQGQPYPLMGACGAS